MKRFINGEVDSSMSNSQKSELPDSKSVWMCSIKTFHPVCVHLSTKDSITLPKRPYSKNTLLLCKGWRIEIGVIRASYQHAYRPNRCLEQTELVASYQRYIDTCLPVPACLILSFGKLFGNMAEGAFVR